MSRRPEELAPEAVEPPSTTPATGRLAGRERQVAAQREGLSARKQELLAALLERRAAAAAGAAASTSLRGAVDPPPEPAASVPPPAPAAASAEPILRRVEDAPAPLSFAQERLWFLDRLQPGNPAYNLPVTLRLTGHPDLAALRRALSTILRRHHALRTVFPLIDGEPVQQVTPPRPCALRVVDLGLLPPPARRREGTRLLAAEAVASFDLTRPPLLRVTLLHLGAEEWIARLNLHHIASDGWSMGVLVRELTLLYRHALDGGPEPLPPLPIQYADYAVWQRQWLAGGVLETQLAFWRRELAAAPPLLELPADRPRPARMSSDGGAWPVLLPAARVAALRALARREGVTLYMLLLAIVEVLLGRTSGQRDLVVGTPVANRGRVETEGLIGFFVNTLPMRGRVEDDLPFRDLLAQVRSGALAAFSHQDVPFEKLVEALHVNRDLGASPLFQAMFVLQNAPRQRLELPGLALEPLALHSGTAKFDLSLELVEDEDVIHGWLEHRRDLFDRSTAGRWVHQLETLLTAVLAEVTTPVGDLPLLAAAERRQLAEWNDTDRAYADADRPLHRLVAEQAARTPEAVAVSFRDEAWSYRELAGRARRLAARLAARGVGPGARVGVCAERSLELPLALLAVLEAGAAYVPLDPEYPPARLAGMVEDARLVVVLAQRRTLAALPASDAEVLLLDAPEAGEGADAAFSPPPAGADEAAYVIFTSGSTGRPKGAINRHRGIVNRLLWKQATFSLTPADRVLQKTPASFDVSVWEFFWPLLVGARLVMAEPGGHRDGAYLVRTIDRERVTTLHFVPSMLRAFLEEPKVAACRSLVRVMASGEALPADLAARFFARLPGVELHNLYGPTEAAVDVTWWRCRPSAASVPIGRPVANTATHVVDRRGRPLPVGVPGELLLGGVQVGGGYLDRPRLTGERFIPDPFAAQAGARLYRTGDLARWRPGGEIEFLGRLDHQVKLRGFRIELGEIETALSDHPAVREARVVLRPGPRSGEPRLVAYVVPAASASAPPAPVLEAALRARLPEHMVPAAFVPLVALPLTPSGKVDLGALPAPAAVGGEARKSVDAPAGPSEELVAGFWRELLGVATPAPGDDFFALGGHSLLATRLVSRLREGLGVVVSVGDLFTARTLRAQAELVDRALEQAELPPMPPLVPRPRAAREPLSYAQSQFWFLDRLAPGSALYNVPAVFHLRGEVAPGALAAAFTEVVRRHEILRTTYGEAAGTPYQRVTPATPVRLPVVDLGGLPPAPRAAAGEELIRRQARRPFDLQRGPLMRLLLVRLARDEGRLAITLHHVASDGWSLDVLAREVAALYATRAPLPALPAQYADYVHWQHERLAGGVGAAQLAWWRRELAGAPARLELPTDRPRPTRPSAEGGALDARLPPPEAAALAALARAQGVTPFMVLAAALQAVLARLSGADEVLLGTPVANRPLPEMEGLVGCFVNTLVLRGRLAGDPPFAELLERTRQTALAAFAHQELPFERLVEALAPERDPSHPPLFQVLFALQNTPREPLHLPGLELRAESAETGMAKLDLALWLVEEAGELRGVLEYRRELFDPTTARRWLGHLRRLLLAAAASPGRRLGELPLLTAGERQQLLREWAGAGAPRHAAAGLVPERVTAQALERPHAVAVEGNGEALTYGSLIRRAARLAGRLERLGVERGMPVGICLERSPQVLVAILGVMRSGGAFVTLDPGYPAARLAMMMDDAGLRVVIADPAVQLPVRPELVLDPAAAVSGPAAPVALSRPSDLAYLLYTSGTSGPPKAVTIEHGSLVFALEACRRTFGFAPGERMLAVASFSFDISLFESLTPLISGGTVRVMRREEVLAPARLVAALAAASRFHAVPGLMRQVVAEVAAGGASPPLLQQLFVGGERVPPELLVEVAAALPGARREVLYGPTEATIVCCHHPVPMASAGPRGMVGRPFPGVVVRVVDRWRGAAPAGAPGELWVAGPGVARGYWQRPELTAERFVERGGDRWYLTGDLVRWGAGGALEFLRRVDHQVKVRGHRVEPGEVEAALAALAGVAAAAVVARPAADGERALVAFAMPRPGRTLDPDALRGDLGELLPGFMVPAAVWVIEELPLDAHGKLDHRRLAALAEELAESAGQGGPTAGPAERSPLPEEELLAVVWSQLLGVERVGRDASFFELGGHSLLAAKLAVRIRDAFGVELPLEKVFEHPTLAGMAAAVVMARGVVERPPLVPAPRQGALPLSFAEERLWVLHQLEPGSPLYNIPLAVELTGHLDLGALLRSLLEVACRHEVLRTLFVRGAEGPSRRIAARPRLAAALIDLSALPAAAGAAVDAELTAREARAPFDLARGPLWRVRLLRLAAERHRTLLTLHHVVGDGWSMGVLLEEVAALYGAFREGRPSPLPPLPVQMADVAVWQRSWLAGELAGQLAYWRQQLAGLPAVLDLPTDRPRGAAAGYAGGRLEVALPAELSAALSALARRRGATLFMALLAALEALLARLSGQTDLAVGSPVANRRTRDVEGLIGCFVNTLVLRGRLDGDPTFDTLLERTRDTALAAFAHEDLPFEKLVDELEVERSLAANPLFQVFFVLQNAPLGELELPGLVLDAADVEVGTAKFDLALSLGEEAGALTGVLEYRRELLDPTTVRRWLGHFETLLWAVTVEPGLRLGELPLLTAVERQQVTRELPDRGAGAAATEPVHRQVAAAAAARPEAVAIEHQGETLTYGELVLRVAALAGRLAASGVRRGEPVGIGLGRSPRVLVAILATWEAAAAYLPLDPAYPAERLAFMSEDAGLRLLLTGGGAAPPAEPPATVIDVDAVVSSTAAAMPPPPPTRPDELAYLIYTSGTSGRPKAVMVEHGNLAFCLTACRRAFALGPGDRMLALASYSFDISLFESLAPLTAGGAVRILGLDERLDLPQLASALTTASRFHAVPALMQQLVGYLSVERGGALSFPLLRHLFVGGERVPPGLLAEMAAAFPGAAREVLYGPTEATIVCSRYPVPPGAGVERALIGRPFAGVEARVVDPWGATAGVGVPGELWIAGPGVSRGYWRRPELTAERFVERGGRRFYRTGDRVRWLPAGQLEFLHRIDQQVKVRGFRVELGEVEAALAAHPGVAEVAAVAWEAGPGDTRLVAYAVPAPGASVTAAELAELAGRRLPDFMVPAVLGVLEVLPVDPNGKLDRRALIARAAQLDAAQPADLEGPRGPEEELLAGIWSELLGVEQIGRRSSFFALGGHSLLATRMGVRVREVLGVELPLRQVFASPTLAELAAHLTSMRGETEARPEPPLVPVPRRGSLPLTFAEERLWFLHQMEPESPFYNLPEALEVRGRLAVGALRAAIAGMVRRQEVLRTTFAAGPAGPYRVIGERPRFAFSLVDLRRLDGAAGEATARWLLAREVALPFDLARGPLVRLRLAWLGEERWQGVINLHHAVGDGWSMGVLVGELGAFYRAAVAGGADATGPGLPPLPVQVADYAVWQRGWLGEARLAEQVAYWRRQLAGLPPVTDLPVDRARPAQRDLVGGRRRVLVPAPLAAELESFAEARGATPFMVLLAALQALLARLTGEGDVAVGAPVANRRRREIEGLVGCFVNTLVLRGHPVAGRSFGDLVEQTRATALGAFAHQDLPFERLVEELAPERDRSTTPLFQVVFALQNAPFEELELPGLVLRPADLDLGTAKFDLSLSLAAADGGLAGFLEYAVDLFDAATAERLARGWVALLAAAAGDPDRALGELPLLSAAEAHQLRHEWNDSAAAFRADAPVEALFAERAAAAPEAVAIEHAGEAWSYGSLDAWSGRIAGMLASAGVGERGPGEPVAICLARSPALVATLVGVLRAGGAYVPLDLAYPPERLAQVIADSRAQVVVSSSDLIEHLAVVLASGSGTASGAAPRVLWLDRETLPAAAPASARGEGAATATAYVIYTSGSTGVPKGVAVPHRAIARLVLGSDYLALGPGEVVAQVSNTAFDAATFEIWGALLTGARLAILPRELTLVPRELAAALRRQRVSALFLTTALLNQVAREEPAAFSSLDTVLFGGEAVDPGSVRRILRATPPRRLLHVYGPTETTTFASWHRVTAVAEGAATVPIGGPLANTTLHVLDAGGRPLPAGAVGELLIGGPGVAAGYHDRPRRTAEHFVPDPFGAPGGRLYVTGDRVRRGHAGAIEFLGRADHQVKLRGFRIELSGIEAALAAHPEVAASAVLLRKGELGDQRLVAYVEPRGGAAPTAAELRSYLEATLPPYMVPAAFVLLGALPLNRNGKVDRKALAAIAPVSEPRGEVARPLTATEELLAGLWRPLLEVEEVRADSDFFALGGHSLLVTRLVSRARDLFAVEVPLRAFFETPTLAAQARQVEAALGAGGGARLPAVTPTRRDGREPLSFAQERLWFLDQLAPGGASYNVLAAFRLAGELAPALLQGAVAEAVRRHEALRTSFPLRDGSPYQRIAPPSAPPLPVVDLSALPVAARRPAAMALARREAGRPFDLVAGPVLRCRLLRLAPDDHLVLIDLHHIVADGWSMEVLARELTVVYAALRHGETSPLPPLPVQYADFARWQRGWLRGEALDAQLAFWREALAAAPPVLELPTDRPRPPVQGLRGGRRELVLPAALSAELRALARRSGATLFMTLLAGFQALLTRYSGQPRVVVGSPVANRRRSELEELVGLFVNNLALVGDLGGAPGFAGLLERTRRTVLGAYAHQDLPFERLVEEVASERSLAHHPIYQVVFTLQQPALGEVELPGLTLTPVEVADGGAKVDLLLALWEAGGDLTGAWQYDADLFDAATVERMGRHLTALLAAGVAEPERPLATLPLLGPRERFQHLVEMNDRPALETPPACLHDLFADRAAERPEAVAVVEGGAALTYGELARRAGRLAARLGACAVQREERVALLVERGMESAVAVWGSLAAGAACVPLDPAYPAERLRFMVTDAGVSLAVVGQGVSPGLLPAGVMPLQLRGATSAVAPVGPLPAAADPAQLAYVIYTSGSTGRPNGVAVPHRAAAHLVRRAVGHFASGPGRRVLAIVSPSFDASILELGLALAAGATLVVADDETRLSGAALAELIDARGVTTAVLTPAVLAQLPADGVPGLATLSVGGEACPGELATAWARGRRLLNCYGPTEATIYATVHPCRGLFRRDPPLGRPVEGVRAHLLGRDLEPVPAGVAGELALAGAGLARGYLGRPRRTAERFVPDPYAALAGEPGARLYLTGDRARRRPGGELEFLGRLDHQVKVRGLRIELGEIEAALARHPAVAEAAVDARTDARGERRLVAYVVPATAEPGLAAALTTALGAALPDYMVPASFVFLPELPLTPTGKVDRRALPAPEEVEGTGGTPPRDPLEHELARLWAEVLGVERIGVESGFFELGGHSLLAVRLLARVGERFGVELPLATLYTAGTVEAMAALLRGEGAAGEASPRVTLRPGRGGRALFLVHPAGGDVLCYAALARHLEADGAVIGLQAPALVADEAPPASIEAMAERYLEEVRAAQPSGPYALAGWSLGGLVAFEMARQLAAAGEVVEPLVVIDTTPGSGETQVPDEVARLLDIALYLETLWGRPLGVTWEELARLGEGERRAAFCDRLAAAGLLPAGTGVAQLERLLAVYGANLAAAGAYRPGRYAAPITLLRAGERPAGEAPAAPSRAALAEPDLGWAEATGAAVEVRELPGNHLTIMAEPAVATLAAAISERLRRERPPARRPSRSATRR